MNATRAVVVDVEQHDREDRPGGAGLYVRGATGATAKMTVAHYELR